MLNRAYRDSATLKRIAAAFRQDARFPSIQLPQVMTSYDRIKKQVSKQKFRRVNKICSGVYSFAEAPAELISFVNSHVFRELLSSVLGRTVNELTGQVLKFSWREYTLRNDELEERPGTDIIIDFTDDWTGREGGEIVYTDLDGEFVSLPVQGNTLTIISRRKGVQKFVKYFNHYSKEKARTFFIATIS